MNESAELLSAFVHGVAAGAMLLIAIGLFRSRLNMHTRVAALLLGVGAAAWFFSESPALFGAVGETTALLLCVLNYPVAGLFWLFVLVFFAEARISPLTVAPAAVLLVSGFVMRAVEPPLFDIIWTGRNILGGLLALHAGIVVLRGVSGDLVEGRRRFRGPLVAAMCLFVVLEVVLGFGYRLTGDERWLVAVVGRPFGGAIIVTLVLALGAGFLQAQPAVLGARRPETGPDPRAEAADRLAIERLSRLMADEGWRREGLTIGDLARELDVPEHRLRRLINQRLGHRNFADFVNGHRIDAAKRRLADPAEARTTVAAIAFDLGYGSLGPFNRAFRAATGSTPTEWRREALAQPSPELREAS